MPTLRKKTKGRSTGDVADQLIRSAKRLSRDVDSLRFGPPVTHVYNPLNYAWKAHQAYLSRASASGARVVFLGMNPGPWGMAQTGVPFGEIDVVRDWIGIEAAVGRPDDEHPKRPVEGFACGRSEVSGRRLWGLFRDTFADSDQFFRDHFVMNYCPLMFMESSARNRTPDKLPGRERGPLDQCCDRHLKRLLEVLKPEHVVGVGVYAEKCLARVIEETGAPAKCSRILHPSPASPAANRGWADQASRQLESAGIWK